MKNRINMKKYVVYGHRSVSYKVEYGCTRSIVPVSMTFRVPADITDLAEIEGCARAALARRFKTAWFVSYNTPDAPAPKLHRLAEKGWI